MHLNLYYINIIKRYTHTTTELLETKIEPVNIIPPII